MKHTGVFTHTNQCRSEHLHGQVRLALKIGSVDFQDERINFPDWPGVCVCARARVCLSLCSYAHVLTRMFSGSPQRSNRRRPSASSLS